MEHDLDIQKAEFCIQADDFTLRLECGVQLPADKTVAAGVHSKSFAAVVVNPYVGHLDDDLYRCERQVSITTQQRHESRNTPTKISMHITVVFSKNCSNVRY